MAGKKFDEAAAMLAGRTLKIYPKLLAGGILIGAPGNKTVRRKNDFPLANAARRVPVRRMPLHSAAHALWGRLGIFDAEVCAGLPPAEGYARGDHTIMEAIGPQKFVA